MSSQHLGLQHTLLSPLLHISRSSSRTENKMDELGRYRKRGSTQESNQRRSPLGIFSLGGSCMCVRCGYGQTVPLS